MKGIPPIAITPASSSVNEPAAGETVWNPATNYAVGVVCIVAAQHRKYERLVAGTTAASPESDPANWRDAGPTNKWAMFDLANSAQTEMTGAPLVVEVLPGQRVDAIGLLGLYGAEVLIEMEVGATVIHSETINLLLRNTTSWKLYYYGQFRVLDGLVRFNLPLSSGATVRITIQPNGGYARCGAIVLGMSEDLGTIIDEPVSDEFSLSKVTRDDFGGASLVKRRTVPQTSHRVRAPAARLNRLRELRADLDASIALFSGVDDREASPFFDTLLVLGFPRKWSIALKAQSVVSDLQLEEI